MIAKTLAQLTLSITDGKHGDCHDQANSGYYFISCKDVKNGRIDYEGARQITEQDFIEANKRTCLEPDDILVTNSGTIGRMACITDAPETSRTTFQKSVAIVKPNTEIVLPRYLYYQLQNCVDQFVNQSNGSAQKNLLLSTMRSFKMLIHEDTRIQHRIADILFKYDNLIENNLTQIKLLEEAARRLYREWFVDLRFPGHEHVQIVDGVPEGWSFLRLCDVANITMGQSPKSEYFNENKIGLPFHQGVGSYGIRFVQNKIYSTSTTRIAEARSILFSVRAPVGRLNITKERIVIGRGLAAICHKKGLQSFLYYMLKDKFFKEDIIGNGSIFASISKEELHQQKLVIPNDGLCEKFDALASMIDRKIENLDSQVRLATEARDRLLPKLMSGEIEL